MITDRELSAIAAPASIWLSQPSAAIAISKSRLEAQQRFQS
jgi:hypothetical protein